MTEPETIEGEVAEVLEQVEPQLPAVREPQEVNLFRTDDPGEIIARATEIANKLTEVLRARKLTKRIGSKDHVLVEGWTLCGTMLGVFAVIEWTKQTENGWEARAEARTLSGAVVGAAEAECLRSESKWADREDYAIRSMAQTRAVSKALRAPLGFIVTMAGFEATPAEEMPAPGQSEPQAVRKEGVQDYPVPKNWVEIEHTIVQADNPAEAWELFKAFLRAAAYHLFGEADQEKLDKEQRMVLLQKASGAAVWLHENVEHEGPDFLFFDEGWQRRAWAAMLDGALLEIPDYVPPEPPHPQVEPEEEAAKMAEDAPTD